ncbi:hypothetical protein LUZ60_003113 [Juncus effusus]|nr:hypothetical protein LUZ60_003113 [Juncus effusus]
MRWRGGGGGATLRSARKAEFAGLMALLLPVLIPDWFTPLGFVSKNIFSEWNAPKPMHPSLLKDALETKISDEKKNEIWAPLAPQGWKPCIKSTTTNKLPKERNGYLQVFLDGGLNQQRMGICDAVAVAKILNATLLIPHLETNPVWQDSSTFEEIYDVDKFIEVLKNEVEIVRELPKEYSWSTREYYYLGVRVTRVKTAPTHASPDWYLQNVLPILQSYGIAAIAPFSHRLGFDDLPDEIQRLRCKVNFQALTFVSHINLLGESLVKHLREGPGGKFAVLHLRFDKDMAAHSGCEFGGGRAERLALGKYRQVIWQGRVAKSGYADSELRSGGKCPLTPEEIGLVLRALGLDSSAPLYLASHKVYGGEARISSLMKLFPLMEDKKSLTSQTDLQSVKGKASLLAAVDFYVSVNSDIFISASPGNMHNAVLAQRTYDNMKSIRPNMPLLGQLFMNESLDWTGFEQAVRTGHKGRFGQIRVRKPKQSIYTYPAPDCMCQF